MKHKENTRSNGHGLRLLFLQPQPCVRTLNYAKALKSILGTSISISLAHTGQNLKTLYGYGDEYFDQVLRKDGGNLSSFISNAVDSAQPDIIHSHNAPDYLTIASLKRSGGAPVIHDTHEVLSVHDSGFFGNDTQESLRRYAREEKVANERSHARIYATEGIREYIQRQYMVDHRSDLVFANYISRKYLLRSVKSKLSKKDGGIHITYVGCITSLLRRSHYYLADVFKEIARHRWHIHIHPTTDLITSSNKAYRKLAARNRFIHYHRHMDRRKLLRKLTQYDYGWAGLNMVGNKRHLEMVLPNKVIEYVACGLPVLAFPHREIRRFIERNQVGIVGKNVDELAELMVNIDLPELQRNVERHRQNLVIEERIPHVVDFYERIAGQLA